jgi:hypothetical protein
MPSCGTYHQTSCSARALLILTGLLSAHSSWPVAAEERADPIQTLIETVTIERRPALERTLSRQLLNLQGAPECRLFLARIGLAAKFAKSTLWHQRELPPRFADLAG